MSKSSASRGDKHRELMACLGYGACTVSAPLQDHKTLQAFGKLLKLEDETAQGILASIAEIADGRPYVPYIPPETEAYEPPEVPIEPAMLDILTKIATELGSLKDMELVSRLERQVQITIDALHAKAFAKSQRLIR